MFSNGQMMSTAVSGWPSDHLAPSRIFTSMVAPSSSHV